MTPNLKLAMDIIETQTVFSYIAIDRNGSVYEYQFKPSYDKKSGDWNNDTGDYQLLCRLEPENVPKRIVDRLMMLEP